MPEVGLHVLYSELILGFSFTCKLCILHSNFAIFEYRSYGYATKKYLHYSTKAKIFGSKQKPRMSSALVLIIFTRIWWK